MRIASLVKVVAPVVALMFAITLLMSGVGTTYASVPAAVTESPEPATRTPQPNPSNTPAPQDTTVPQPTTPPENTPPPANTPLPQATNTRQRDEGGSKKGVQISLRKEASSSDPVVGNTVEFRLIANNTGDETAQDVVITDPLPAFLKLVGATASQGSVVIDGNTVVVNVGSVGPGNTVIIVVTATIVSDPRPPDNRNIATLTTSSTEDKSDNSSSVEFRRPDSGDSNPSPTPAVPTDTPLPGVTTSPVPTVPATATPLPPVSLPPTGDSGTPVAFWLAVAAIGAMSIFLGALLRRRKA